MSTLVPTHSALQSLLVLQLATRDFVINGQQTIFNNEHSQQLYQSVDVVLIKKMTAIFLSNTSSIYQYRDEILSN